MSGGLVTVSYIGAIILFVMTLGGLSHQETSRKGNLYGMIGMTIAVLATVFGPEVTTKYPSYCNRYANWWLNRIYTC